MSSPIATISPVANLLGKLQGVRKEGAGWAARCPAHEDHRASLTIGIGSDGKALLRCHAGCHYDAVLGAVGLRKRDLFEAPRKVKAKEKREGPIVAAYVYRDEAGKTLFRVTRHDPKEFLQWRYENSATAAGWARGVKGVRKVLYRLDELKASDAGALVFVVEGEKDADALVSLGLIATTNPGGADRGGHGKGKWLEGYTESLRGRHVVIVPDNDDPGRDHAQLVARALHGVASTVRVLELPGLEPKGDVSDWLGAGGAAPRLRDLAFETPLWVPPDPIRFTVHTGGNGGPGPFPPNNRDPLRLHDTGNGERFSRQHGEDVRYCHAQHKWYVWDGRRWAVDNTGEVERRAKATAYGIYDEASDAGKAGRADDSEALAKWAKRSLEVAKLSAMLKAAESEPGIGVSPSQFDNDVWALNVLNGTLDLTTGELRPHRREDLITKLSPVYFAEDAECPVFESFVSSSMKGRAELVGFLQRFLGYCLTGSVREQVFVFFYGAGANGKSTLLDLLLHVMGDYSLQTVSDLLMSQASGSERHPTELADLFGRRLAVSIEAEVGRMLAEARTKQLTGGDKIRARRMREDFWEFSPTHKLILAANHKPVVRGTDHGIWRRILMVPFETKAVDPELETPCPPDTIARDSDLPAKLENELSGVLAWLVRGCQEWRNSGLNPPKSVRAAVDEYHDEMDAIGQFIEEACELGPDLEIEVHLLYATYSAWSTNRGDRKPMHSNAFSRELTSKGIGTRKGSGGVRLRVGVALRSGGNGAMAQDRGINALVNPSCKSNPLNHRPSATSATDDLFVDIDLSDPEEGS